MNLIDLANEIIEGRRINRDDDLSFFITCDLKELCEGADRIREHFVGNKVDLCSIINGRSGKCPEDCKYCAQSAHNHTDCEIYDFLEEDIISKVLQRVLQLIPNIPELQSLQVVTMIFLNRLKSRLKSLLM